MRLLRTGVTTYFHPVGEFVGRDADERWALQEAEMWAFRQNDILQ